jgi:hypothetical protein
LRVARQLAAITRPGCNQRVAGEVGKEGLPIAHFGRQWQRVTMFRLDT